MSALSDAIDANNAALRAVSAPDLVELDRAMKLAKREIERELAKTLTDYQRHRAHSALHQIDRAARKLGKAGERAMGRELAKKGRKAGQAATKSLARIIAAGEKMFVGSVQPLRLDVAAVLASSRRSMMARWSNSAHGYGANLEIDIRRTLMTGIIRGETVDQMASRVLRGTGLINKVKGDLARQVSAIVSNPLDRARRTAERIVRTETVNAYNTVAVDQIHEMNRDDPGYLIKWDAANDRRVCVICRALDREVVAPGESFPGGYDQPPAHWNCRCAAVAWRKEWGTP